MAYPTIVFNNSTGSDTAASGAGPATALTGSSASFTGSVVTLDGSPDLTNVATDGSHVLYLVTSTGRKFFTINAKDNTAKTVTTNDAPAGTASGLSWAIGGKRSTFDSTDSRLLLSTDAKAGWIVQTETDQTVTSTALSLKSAEWTLRGTDADTLKVVNQTANAGTFSGGAYALIENLKITNSNGTKSAAYGHNGPGSADTHAYFSNCVFGDATNQLYAAYGEFGRFYLYWCVIQNCTYRLLSSNVNSGAFWYNVQYINNSGYYQEPFYGGNYYNCLFANNTSDGVVAQAGFGTFINCTFVDNDNDGIDSSSATATTGALISCIIAYNGGYGVNTVAGYTRLVYNNTFYSNTSGARNNLPVGEGDNTDDPQFTNRAGGDYTVGANMKGAGYRSGADQTTSKSYTDRGGLQRQEPSGGIPNTTKVFTNIGTY